MMEWEALCPSRSRLRGIGIGVMISAIAGCSTLEIDPPSDVIHARFDPDAEVIPMPTDILRDAARARLDIPLDSADLTAAEVDLYGYLNTLDGWPSTMAATVELTAPIAPTTLNGDTLQVWHWRETPELVEDARVSLDPTETKITIDAPREGWERGGTYFVVLRGGAGGVEGKRGEKVECDAAFYFLRLTQPLDTVEHERAFPGNSRAERRDNAEKLEEIREQLSPLFDFAAAHGIPRDQVAALWSFTVTERVELAMDKASQRMPIPMDLLLDPTTHRIDIPVAEWDSQVEKDAKRRLTELDGFAISANLMFGFTGPIDPATINADTVQLYATTDPPQLVSTEATVLEDGMHVELALQGPPLEEDTRYAVVLRPGIRDADGGEIALMPVGRLALSRAPVLVQDRSQVDAVDDADALKLETLRQEVNAFTDVLGTDDLLAVWTFTTMSITEPMKHWMAQPEQIGVSPDPAGVETMTPLEAANDFLLGVASLVNVGTVYQGTIESPVFLDRITRGWRTDGGYEIQNIGFTMTVPKNVDPETELPVVIFGHGLMTERRFVLAVADQLAARGYAAVAIDLPYHGERTYCWNGGPISIPDPTTGELTDIADPCQAGYTCAEDGRCVDAANQGNALAVFPGVGMYAATGAAFIEIEQIANTNDHFRQSLIDLAALSRSLQSGDWQSIVGAPLKTDRISYLGMSLGGVIGASFVPLSPEIDRAVLNVPGADLVELFDQSPFFGDHVDAFFTREGIDRDSFEGHRFLNVARWFMDGSDGQSFARHLLDNNRQVMLQMALADIIIPNAATLRIEELSGAPRFDYAAEHAFLIMPIEPEYLRGNLEVANFIAQGVTP